MPSAGGAAVGVQLEGVFRQAAVVKGRNRDTAWFAIIDKEWPALAEAYAAWLSPSNFDAKGRQLERLSDLTRAGARRVRSGFGRLTPTLSSHEGEGSAIERVTP